MCEQCGKTLASSGGFLLHEQQHASPDDPADQPAARGGRRAYPQRHPPGPNHYHYKGRGRGYGHSGGRGGRAGKRTVASVLAMAIGIGAGRWAARELLFPDRNRPAAPIEQTTDYPRTVIGH